ncbi:MAG: 2-oxoglutarate dehydrogenase complex dihydrolipoyllysine-residue succinyltransferase, partial [Gammaproteobacteria bacterium]|nr:2-oxoglutarate dehydrogenase complex dihydrolipoyllysine-residue succinyltransferase [Gammaproteobacteria bacterium]
MSIEVKVPQLPESVADGTLTQWNKKVGDAVARDEELVSLETDKVMLGVPAPVSGTLVEIRVAGGSTVTSGQVLAVIAEGAVAAAAAPVAAEAPAAAESAKLAPSVRRLVEENKLDPAAIAGSGRDGRITKGDVVQHLATPALAAPPVAPATRPAATAAVAPAAPRGGRVDQRVPMTRLRSRIAQRLVEAQATQALLTTFNEVDMTALNGLRARYKESFEKKYGVRLGFMSFYVKACTEALKRFPMVNASVEGNDIVYHEFYDVGVAVSTDRGLIVPVLRDADLMSCADIERAVVGYAQRAREGSITLEELTGGTFSITNGGVFGSLLSTPIVNAPQSAILGMHKVQ